MTSPATPEDDTPQEQQLELGEDENAIALRRAWERTLRSLAPQINAQTLNNWLKPLKPLSLEGSIVVIGALTPFARQWVENKYAQPLRAMLSQHLNLPDLQLRFVVSTPKVQPLLGEKPLPLQQAAAPDPPAAPPKEANALVAPDARNPFVFELAASPLNERYTFDQFVVGKSNRMAFAGAQAVASEPGKVNPLFIYGNPGLGKTHMLHAIGHQIRQNLPQARIAYISGETFTNHYVAGIRDKKMEDFRRAYRTVDVWLVDDIQTIASREGTKEEFFHTFNALYQSKRQIVITSDRSPRDLRLMDERLRSRFEQGLFADIGAPDLEMRQAILQKKAMLENLRIPDEVIAFMADLIQSNIRALEGALAKLMVYASVVGSPVTKQLARDVLSSYFVERLPPAQPQLASAHPEDHDGPEEVSGNGKTPLPTLDMVVDTVAAQLRVAREAILAGGGRSSRSRTLVGDPAFARQAAMYLSKEMCGLPATALAAAFGLKNRTAVTHAHNRMQEELQTSMEALTVINNIRKVILYNLQ